MKGVVQAKNKHNSLLTPLKKNGVQLGGINKN